jgi:hypothetical protein
MNYNRSWKSALLIWLCLCILSSEGARAQTPDANDSAGTAAPPNTGFVGTSAPKDPKTWYPRLTGLSIEPFDETTFTLEGAQYESRDLFVGFFSSATADQVTTALGRFETEEVKKSQDGTGYYLTLVNARDLFPAVDFYNDLPEVKTAHLIQVFSNKGVPSSPLSPTTVADASQSQPSFFPGDVNGDFQWRINDVQSILLTAIKLSRLEGFAAVRADVNRNGRIDVPDAVLALGLVVGKGLPAPYGYPR